MTKWTLLVLSSVLIDGTPASAQMTLDKLVDLAVTIEQPGWGHSDRVRKRFRYLFPEIKKHCAFTYQQAGDYTAFSLNSIHDKGVDESYLDLVERFHQVLSQTTYLRGSTSEVKVENCMFILALYSQLRIDGMEGPKATRDLIQMINALMGL